MNTTIYTQVLEARGDEDFSAVYTSVQPKK